MRIILAVAVALAACPLTVSAAAASPPPGVAVSEVAPFHYAGAVSAPRSVRLATSNGDITATASTDGKLDVRAVVTDGDPSRVRVITREEAGGVAICVLFADESPDGCRLSGVSSSSGGRNHANEPSITLVARIPAGVSLAASAMNGAIHAHGMTAEVRATTLNGDVDVSAATVPEATTLNGNVTASFASAPRGKVELSTNNGNVRANLPSGVDADIDAETSNGEIMVTFPMAIDAVPGGFGPKSGHARLGKGGGADRCAHDERERRDQDGRLRVGLGRFERSGRARQGRGGG